MAMAWRGAARLWARRLCAGTTGSGSARVRAWAGAWWAERHAHHAARADGHACVPGEQRVLVVKKTHSKRADEATGSIVKWMREQWPRMTLLREAGRVEGALQALEPLHETPTADELGAVDFVVVVGGDGTIIHTSALFPDAPPPMFTVSMGSVGFLTTFTMVDYQPALASVVAGDFLVQERSRLFAEMRRTDESAPRMIPVMNELALHRGASPSVCTLDISVDRVPVTRMSGDGLVLSTPTGSTAYGLSLGGPMVHPRVSASVLTPISPLSLSFRPVVLPLSCVVDVHVSAESRSPVQCAVDGVPSAQLRPGDAVRVCENAHPLLTVARDTTGDWIENIKRVLRWNQGFREWRVDH